MEKTLRAQPMHLPRFIETNNDEAEWSDRDRLPWGQAWWRIGGLSLLLIAVIVAAVEIPYFLG